jgi:hypothetical protein
LLRAAPNVPIYREPRLSCGRPMPAKERKLPRG